jgi:hypothetical protein
MNLTEKNKDELRLEMLRLKLQKSHTQEDKLRIQYIQQLLDKDEPIQKK